MGSKKRSSWSKQKAEFAAGLDDFSGMDDIFAREVRKYAQSVIMTTVDTTISHEDEAKCQIICDELGVRYRIRAWVD